MSDQVKMRLISQLVKFMSSVYKKLLKYFDGTIISTSCSPLAPVMPVIFWFKFKWSTIILPTWKVLIAPASIKVGSSL